MSNNTTKTAENGYKSNVLANYLKTQCSASEMASIIEEITANYFFMAQSNNELALETAAVDFYHLRKLRDLFFAIALEGGEDLRFYNEQIIKNL